MTTEDDGRRELTKIAGSLARQVGDLSLAVTAQGQRADKHSKALRLTVFGLILDVTLSIAVGIGYYKISDVVQNQQAIRRDAICPLLAVMLGSYQPTTREPGQARQAYDDAYVVMRRIYGPALGCTIALVPPRTDLPVPK